MTEYTAVIFLQKTAVWNWQKNKRKSEALKTMVVIRGWELGSCVRDMFLGRDGLEL